MDDNHVLVKGPRGSHIEVHKTTQAAMPEAFPLVEHKQAASAENSTVDDKKEPENGD
jgi:hypothetical protein